MTCALAAGARPRALAVAALTGVALDGVVGVLEVVAVQRLVDAVRSRPLLTSAGSRPARRAGLVHVPCRRGRAGLVGAVAEASSRHRHRCSALALGTPRWACRPSRATWDPPSASRAAVARFLHDLQVPSLMRSGPPRWTCWSGSPRRESACEGDSDPDVSSRAMLRAPSEGRWERNGAGKGNPAPGARSQERIAPARATTWNVAVVSRCCAQAVALGERVPDVVVLQEVSAHAAALVGGAVGAGCLLIELHAAPTRTRAPVGRRRTGAAVVVDACLLPSVAETCCARGGDRDAHRSRPERGQRPDQAADAPAVRAGRPTAAGPRSLRRSQHPAPGASDGPVIRSRATAGTFARSAVGRGMRRSSASFPGCADRFTDAFRVLHGYAERCRAGPCGRIVGQGAAGASTIVFAVGLGAWPRAAPITTPGAKDGVSDHAPLEADLGR